jgi:serine/threonine protein kinase
MAPWINDSPPLPSSSDSRSSLLVTGDSSRNSLGYCLPMQMRIKMVRDCCAGVAFLHSRGLMHCDIKSLNFLITRDFVVKLSDLGEARPYKATHVDRIKLPKYLHPSSSSLSPPPPPSSSRQEYQLERSRDPDGQWERGHGAVRCLVLGRGGC